MESDVCGGEIFNKLLQRVTAMEEASRHYISSFWGPDPFLFFFFLFWVAETGLF